MKKAIHGTWWLRGLVSAILVCLLVHCGGGGGNGGGNPGGGGEGGGGGGLSPEESAVLALQNDMLTAYQKKDAVAVMAFFSADYRNGPETYAYVENMLNKAFQDPDFDPAGADILSTEQVGDQVYCLLHWEDMEPCHTDYFIWHNENGVWKIYGNQELYYLHIGSNRQSNGEYLVSIAIEDQSHQITSISVTGPGLAGATDLVYLGGDWGFSSYPSLGTSAPTTPQSYVITITDGTGSHQYTRTVTGYVQQAATNLSPTGLVSSVTFSWTGVEGACGYRVELRDGPNSWRSDQTTATSLAYAGPALVAGHTYTYSVAAIIQTGGEENQSVAQGQFTYQP